MVGRVYLERQVLIRIFHEFVDRIRDSFPRVNVLHHEAPPSDAKQLPEGQMYPSFPQIHAGFFLLHIQLGASA